MLLTEEMQNGCVGWEALGDAEPDEQMASEVARGAGRGGRGKEI